MVLGTGYWTVDTPSDVPRGYRETPHKATKRATKRITRILPASAQAFDHEYERLHESLTTNPLDYALERIKRITRILPASAQAFDHEYERLYLSSEVGGVSLNAQPRGLRESMLYAKFPDTLLSVFRDVFTIKPDYVL